MDQTPSQADAPASPDLIVVLGMHRSGTSLLAEALHRGGLHVAPERIDDEPAVNARGFWEDRRIVGLNEALLECLGSSWYDLRKLPDGWLERGEVKGLLDQAAEYLREEYAASLPAVIKDPRLCRLLPFWQLAFELCGLSAGYVLLLRSPSAVARSLYRRNRLPLNYGLLLTLRYLQEAEQATAYCQRTIVDYDQLLEGGLELLGSVFAEFGLPMHDEALASVFDSSLRHHLPVTEDDEAAVESLKGYVMAEYRRLLSSDAQRSAKRIAQEAARAADESGIPSADELLDLSIALAAVHLENQAELVRIGELHQHALQIIEERDRQLDQSNRRGETAEALVRERDEELSRRNSDCEYAEQLVRQRDEELSRRNADCEYAESLVRQRDEELKQANASRAHAESIVEERDRQLNELRNSLIGRVLLRRLRKLDSE